MNKDFVEQVLGEHQSTPKCPSPREVGKWFNKLLAILFPGTCEVEFKTQKEIFSNSTHFNPVDLVCSTRDYEGKYFNLLGFRDMSTGFITEKTKDGRKLKAQELPGLWNGAMAHWNTIFVEVPLDTFNPVKTVTDLLRPAHQND